MELDSQAIMAVEPNVQGLPFGSGGNGGWLPWFIVVPVQLASMFWELGVVAIVTLPFWSVVATIATLDWLLDWVFLLTIGLICRPCAGLFIWVINIAMIPFMLVGWGQRFFLETFGLVIDGWMMLFKFSGCYLRFGHHCWWTPRWKHRSMRTAFDIPYMIASGESLKDVLIDFMTPPTIENNKDFLAVRAANRAPLLNLLPGYSQASTIYRVVSENFDF